ncbi:transposase [Undibacterium sp. Ji49W]|uniref:transposase n=1 Tax=Undibacterium sp. Ji49W TaxID=3413040 RepID=UPI003BEF88A7
MITSVLADKAYDADACMMEPLEATARMMFIPPKKNRKQTREHDKHLYKERHLIELFFCKLKQSRAIATRYDKTARNFLTAYSLAVAFIWLA